MTTSWQHVNYSTPTSSKKKTPAELQKALAVRGDGDGVLVHGGWDLIGPRAADAGSRLGRQMESEYFELRLSLGFLGSLGLGKPKDLSLKTNMCTLCTLCNA